MSHLFAYLAVAYLTGLLAGKLRQVDAKLKHTRGALQNLQAVHENIIQSISGGLITTGLDGHITLVNTAGQKVREVGATQAVLDLKSQVEAFKEQVQNVE